MYSQNCQETLNFDDAMLANQLFGAHNLHLSLVAERTGACLSTKGASLCVESEDNHLRETLVNLFVQMYGLVKSGQNIGPDDFTEGLSLLRDKPDTDLRTIYNDGIVQISPRKSIKAKNLSQKRYISALRSHEMVFAIGPAGTGKTYLTVAVALSMLMRREIRRVILARPAVEAGERLGFLPGDMADKVNPYLRPLYDALHDMLGPQKMPAMQESGIIEVAPLAFMRGRTLNDAFIILDEAQNTTREQMKMFLTRLGFGSRAAITGDITQIDLPATGGHNARERSGLIHVMQILQNVPGIAFCQFGAEDVTRHPLVGRIVNAYQVSEKLPGHG